MSRTNLGKNRLSALVLFGMAPAVTKLPPDFGAD
ncbi:hypothetical protein RAM_29410 [Amycolatopsis mediterranei S699]|uniref:Uncharacterized protein n=1 Tax=Amycolatopsis mediterranei (strain S699) TaxID=713604 RepID=A0A9R0P132_AMYMS|nr:hypothetical protein RAM_29410 [Amycolatopsis mediterranei S699]